MTVLRGPADADHYRVKVGRYGDRWYCDPLPADGIAPATDETWPSVSTIKKASGSDWSYVAMKRIATANLQRLPEMKVDEAYEFLKSINKLGLERAGARGTQVHRWLEQALRGEEIGLDPDFPDVPGANYLDAVKGFLDTYQPELVAAEMVCINRILGYAGTADAIVRIDGQDYWVDWKSKGEDSDHGAYPEEAAQLAAYADADYMIVEGRSGPERLPMPAMDVGLIVSIKPDGCRIYPINIVGAAQHWFNMLCWWKGRRVEREFIGKPWAPRKIAGGASTTAVMAEAPPAFDRRQWVKDRILALSVPGRKHLGQHWPEGVPTFKTSETHTDAELDLIIAALDDAERETEAPFPAAEPKPVEALVLVEYLDKPPDEGPDVTLVDLEAAAKLYQKHKLELDAWAEQVHADGGRSLNLKLKPSLWRWTVMTSLAHCARAGVDDDGLRDLLYVVTKDQACLVIDKGTRWALGKPLGALIAGLTIAQAADLGRVARAFADDPTRLTWTLEGVPEFKVA